MNFPWPWPKATAVASISKNLLVCTTKWESFIRSLQILFKNFGCVSSRSKTILALSQEWLSDWCETKKKVHRLDTGYNMWSWPFCLTHDPDLGYFKVNFRNSCISWIVGLIDVKWKGSESIGYWADYMTLPFDHIHDLDFGVCNSLISWMVRLTWNKKDVSHPFMTMILISVIMVCGWIVPDSAYPEHRVSPQLSYPAPHSWHGHPHDPSGLCHGWLLPD